MFDVRELETIATACDLSRKSLVFLENFNVRNDDFYVAARKVAEKCAALIKEAGAKTEEAKG